MHDRSLGYWNARHSCSSSGRLPFAACRRSYSAACWGINVLPSNDASSIASDIRPSHIWNIENRRLCRLYRAAQGLTKTAVVFVAATISSRDRQSSARTTAMNCSCEWIDFAFPPATRPLWQRVTYCFGRPAFRIEYQLDGNAIDQGKPASGDPAASGPSPVWEPSAGRCRRSASISVTCSETAHAFRRKVLTFSPPLPARDCQLLL